MIKETAAIALSIAISGSTFSGGVSKSIFTESTSKTIIQAGLDLASKDMKFLSHTEKVVQEYYEELERKRLEEERIRLEEERKRLEEERLRQEYIAKVTADNNRKENVYFDPYNLTSKSGITATELYEVLTHFSNGSLSQLAWAFVEAENTYGVNALFIAALVAQESGWGTSYRAQYQNNMTGHAVYNSNAEGTTFASKEESVLITAEMLQKNYLTPGGPYNQGLSIWNVNSSYCFDEAGINPDYDWADNISKIAYSLQDCYHENVKVLESF